MKNALIRGTLSVLVLLGAASAFGHDPGLSSINVDLRDAEIEVVQTFNDRDIAGLTAVPKDLLPRALRVEFDGEVETPILFNARTDANHNVELQFAFARVKGTHRVTFRSPLLKDLPSGHRQALTVREPGGREILSVLLSAQTESANLVLEENPAAPSKANAFFEFLRLGIRHILTGYDHLFFLFGLLVMCRSIRPAVLLITCFTVAHSITLALSTFGLVNLPSRFVEAAIAASILYVGIENLFRHDPPIRGRALLTFAFGLIHGLGFASVLREMGVANSGSAAVVPLLAFNVGVELGQLCVAAILLPAIWALRRNAPLLRIALPACSMAIALAGAFWLIERTVF